VCLQHISVTNIQTLEAAYKANPGMLVNVVNITTLNKIIALNGGRCELDANSSHIFQVITIALFAKLTENRQVVDVTAWNVWHWSTCMKRDDGDF